MPKWELIETAPRDKMVLLFGEQKPHEFVNFSEPLVFSGYWDVIDEAWCSTASSWSGPFYKPTHWMPLPEAPEA